MALNPREGDFPEAGTMSDRAVAKLHGVGHATISRYRRRFGIPEFDPMSIKRFVVEHAGLGTTSPAWATPPA